jgi:hypothetical protein
MNPHPPTRSLNKIWADGFAKGIDKWIGKSPYKSGDTRAKAWMEGYSQGHSESTKP